MYGVIAAGAGLIAVVALVWRAVRAAGHDERKKSVSWWATRHGWRYTRGSDELLGHLRGTPFDRGTSRDVQDLLAGTVSGRPALVTQFSWYLTPDAEQSDTTGSSGIRSGVCAAAVVELPAPVPELTVRRQGSADLVRGRDIEFESGRFNATFRVSCDEPKFAQDVVHPRLMALLLDDPRSQRYAFRLDGPMLVVWRDSMVDHGAELAELVGYAELLVGMIPDFVYRSGWRASDQQPISAIPATAYGEPPIGAVHFLQRLEYRGHEIERYEHVHELWGHRRWSVVAKVEAPTLWPVLMVAPKRLAPPGTQPRFDDAVLSGDRRFDDLFSCGSPDPAFAALVLGPELTGWLSEDPRAQQALFVFQSELMPDGRGKRAILSVVADGRLSDPALADLVTELVCDAYERLPADALELPPA